MEAPVYGDNGNADFKRRLKVTEQNRSTNPFWPEMTETIRANFDFNGNNTNPFLTSMELTATQIEHRGGKKQTAAAWPLTPPPSGHTNPFLTPAETAGCGARAANIYSSTPLMCKCDANENKVFQAPHKSVNWEHVAAGLPAQTQDPPLFLPETAISFCAPAQSFSPSPLLSVQPHAGGPECDSDRPGHRRSKAVPRRHSRQLVLEDYTDSSDEEYNKNRERIPTLRPGNFDGTGSWKGFVCQFETCARANHWTEETKAIQLRFCLSGAAGAIVHKNPNSANWSYQRLVKEVDAAYGPRSEHAAAIGIELRQRVRKPDESMHTLRDDIYEKVAIVYGDRSELEQDSIAVDIFTNAMTDADIIQKLLEEKPPSLARAYNIAHRYETTRKAARAVTQMMRPALGSRSSAARTALVLEDTSAPTCDQPRCAPVTPSQHQQGAPKARQPKTGPNKVTSGEVICHNCSGVGHIQKQCPSPRRPRQQQVSFTPNLSPNNSAVIVCGKSQEDEMCVQIMIHGLKLCALLDSGARRNVLPLHHFNSLPTQFKPPVQPSLAKVLQGIGPEGLAVLGEVVLPVLVGSKKTDVNFIMADIAQGTEVILGHPFLRQSNACLDYGRREISLFDEKIPRYDPNCQPAVTHVVRVARTTVLEPGREYVVPGSFSHRSTMGGDLLLSPTKAFVEKHRALVAHAVVQPRKSSGIPIRIFNPGATPVTLKRGAVAGVLQPAEVVGTLAPPPAPSEPGHINSVSVPPHLQVLYEESCSILSESDCHKLAHLLQSFGDVFSTGPADLGRTSIVQHDIQTTPGPPVKQPPRRMATDKQLASDQQLQQSLDAGVAQPSNSSWAAPIVVVRKKDKTPRLCVDYRPLNERTIKDAYPLPRIQDTLDTLSTARYFSTLDLTSGYWQVEMTPRARKAAAFCTRQGLFEWNVMLFGLCNAPATFQRLMDRVLVGLQWQTCLVYLDDIVVLGKDATQMLERLEQVFSRLRQANLKLKPSKCCLFREEVAYLGHIVSASGIATDPQKTERVRDWPTPRNVSEVRQFVGLASYYRRFVPDFATIAKPLHELTKKYARFSWTAQCQGAFDELKRLLTSAPVLGYPLDEGEMFLDTDASDCGIGAVLCQVQGGEERVLAYGSRRLSAVEQNYCTTRRELLAVVDFTSHFKQYLLGRPFTVRTDHSSLRWLTRLREPEGQLARWLEKLAEYDFTVIHRPGRVHQNADALSRRPCQASCPCTIKDPEHSSDYYHDKAVQCDLPDHATLAVPLVSTTGQTLVGVVEPEPPAVGVGDTHDRSDAVSFSIHRVGEPQQTLFQGWTQEQLTTAQKTDPDIAPVWQWVDSGGSRPPWSTIAPYSPATKAYCSQWKRLYMKDGVLMRKFFCPEGQTFYPQVLLPQTLREAVMEQMHSGPVGGHFGGERTLARVKTRYFWYNMRDDVTLWCRTCISCAAKARPNKTPQAGMGTVHVGAPMERIAVDLMGPLNETERHNRFIIVVQDYFSKWAEAYPVPNEQALTVAEKVVSEWVCRFGAPHTLHSDQGTNFESAVFQGMCELLGIEKTRTTPFHPQSDGHVERLNATLQKTLAATSERCHWDWDLMLPYAVMAYRATKHSSTGITPNMMLFGREITEPIDLVAGLPPNDSVSSQPDYVIKLREQLELSHRLTREVLGKASERAKRQYDKNICQTKYPVGAAVWHLVKGTKRVRHKVRKFLPSYEGPYFIVGQLDDLVYQIQKGPRTKIKVVHHDKLKPFHSRTPLDNSWVLQKDDASTPLEVSPPFTDIDSDPDIGPLQLWDSTSAVEDISADTTEDAGSSLLVSPPADSNPPPASPARPQGGEVDAPRPTRSVGQQGPSAVTPLSRPQRTRRAPDKFGVWLSH